MATKNSWNNTISAADVTLNGGVVNIGTDAVGNAINIGTGAAARTITISNTTGATALNLKTGTGDFTLASATGTIMNAADTGEINYPLQPAFMATITSTITNVTGDGTLYMVIFDTEVFDQNNDFDGISTFTAPVTGRYSFQFILTVEGLTLAENVGTLKIATSNRNYQNSIYNPGAMRDSNNRCSFSNSILCDMDVSDTATFSIIIGNGTKIVDVYSNGVSDPYTYVSGYLAV